MASYIRYDSYLLEYFGQKESADCGTCDVCRRTKKGQQQKNTAASEDAAAEISAYINGEMNGCYTLEDMSRRFGSPDSASAHIWKEVLRRLIDQGTVPPPQV